MLKIIKAIRYPKIFLIYVLKFKVFRIIPDSIYIKIKYKLCIGKKLNLKNVQTFNEKLQWLKLHDRNPMYTNLADKYQVRKYIKKVIGKEYLVPLIGAYDNFDEIDFDVLPKEFVLKPNHTSGNIYICRDKSKIDYAKLKKEVNRWLRRRYYWVHREWPYKAIKPRIICEKFISDKNNVPYDYKVLCFNGKAKFIALHVDRFGNHKQDYYDEKWNKKLISKRHLGSDIVYPKPMEFEKMIELSEKLAADMIHVRIDWMITQDKLNFSEITFYEGAGFNPFDKEEYDYLLGSLIKLP